MDKNTNANVKESRGKVSEYALKRDNNYSIYHEINSEIKPGLELENVQINVKMSERFPN